MWLLVLGSEDLRTSLRSESSNGTGPKDDSFHWCRAFRLSLVPRSEARIVLGPSPIAEAALEIRRLTLRAHAGSTGQPNHRGCAAATQTLGPGGEKGECAPGSPRPDIRARCHHRAEGGELAGHGAYDVYL